jgi:hypothetical protein
MDEKKKDRDGDGVPDAVEIAKTKEAAEAAKARLSELKAKLDKDGDGTPDIMANLSEEQRKALEAGRAKAAELKAAQAKKDKPDNG